MKSYYGASITLVALACGVSAQAQEVWGNAEVDAYIVAHQSAEEETSSDPFAAPAASSGPPASSIVLTYDVPHSEDVPDDYLTFVRWDYDSSAQTMTLTSSIDNATLVNFDFEGASYDILRTPRGNDQWLTFKSVEHRDGGTGQNAYGATAQLTEVRREERGIIEMTPGFSRVGPGSNGRDYVSRLVHTFQISPEEGRALSQHIQLQVVATPVQWAPGKWVICGTSYNGATIRNPTVSFGQYCYLNTEAQTYRFVDTRDNTVLVEWQRPAQQEGRRRR